MKTDNMNKVRDYDPEKLDQLAWEYITECIEATTEVATGRGAVTIKERRVPTLRYFLDIWLRQRGEPFYRKSQWYNVLNDEEHPLYATVKGIQEVFNALAVDIVANEGKAIFYAKNRLGMSDKIEQHTETSITTLAVNVKHSGLLPAKTEKEIDLH